MLIYKFTLAALLLFASSVFADTYQLNARGYFIRSTRAFGSSQKNIVGIMTQGAKFELLEVVSRPDGSQALRIRVIDPSTNGNVNPSPTDNYWVYKSNETDFSRLTTGGTPVVNSYSSCPSCRTNQTGPVTTGQTDPIAAVVRRATRNEEVPPTDIAPPVVRTAPVRNNGPITYAQNIVNYSNSPKTLATINYAIRHNTKTRGGGKCYRNVKEALACGPKGSRGSGNCLIPSWYGGVPASGAKNDLKRYGFINLLDTPPYKGNLTSARQAPKGSVLVYSNGVPCRGTRIPDCGHVEIKTGEGDSGAYVSDFTMPYPINDTPRVRASGGRTRYKLIGVMVKPM